MTDCSIVIPVYNSADSLPDLVTRLAAAMPQIANRYELLLVNDGSRDASWSVISGLADKYPWVRGINLMRNYGQHNALLAGIRAALYPIVITMDDDLQHPPDQIPFLLAELEKGYDVVYGTPEQQQHGLWRDLSSSATKFIMRTTTGVKVASQGSPFRAFRTSLRKAFANYDSPSVMIDVLLSWGTTRFSAVKVRHDPRRRGKSNYSFFKLLILAIDLTTSFTTWPLRLASLTGFAVTLLGLITLVWVLVEAAITGHTLSLYRYVSAVVAVFAGAQLFGMGIIGEYLGRMHQRMMARPPYVIRERTQSVEAAELENA